MKRTLICILIILATNLYAEKKARLIIHSNNSNILKFISYIKVVGQDTTYSRNMSFIKEEFVIKDIIRGKYKIKFYSIFNDSIINQIEILKERKYNVSFPNFCYRKTENFEEFYEKLIRTDKINIYVFTRVGDLSSYSQRIYINKSNSYYFKQVFGLDLNEHTDELVLSKETNYERIKKEINQFINLSRNNERNCGNLLKEIISHAIIMTDNDYYDFSFCPEKHIELDNITRTINENSESF